MYGRYVVAPWADRTNPRYMQRCRPCVNHRGPPFLERLPRWARYLWLSILGGFSRASRDGEAFATKASSGSVASLPSGRTHPRTCRLAVPVSFRPRARIDRFRFPRSGRRSWQARRQSPCAWRRRSKRRLNRRLALTLTRPRVRCRKLCCCSCSRCATTRCPGKRSLKLVI